MNFLFPTLLLAMAVLILALAASFGVCLGSRLASVLFNRKKSSNPPR